MRCSRFVFVVSLYIAASCACDIKLLIDIASLPMSTDGYQVEQLSLTFTASIAQGDNVYVGMSDGTILLVNDHDPEGGSESLGQPFETGPRMVFVSRVGDVFVSVSGEPVMRWSAESGNGRKFWTCRSGE